MINAVDHALRNIYSNIPMEILELAFDQKGKRKSLDEAIIDEVIEGRVRPDVSAIAGQYKEIVLIPEWAMTTNIYPAGGNVSPILPYAVYTIPPEAREHRLLTAVLGIAVPYGATNALSMMSNGLFGGTNPGLNAGALGCQLMNAHTYQHLPTMPTPILLAGNQVRITPVEMSLISSFSWILKCRLEYDKDFTNLTPNAVIQLSELILTATKAWIYNQLTVRLEMGYVHSGQEIGRVKEIIDQYQDQSERYNVIRTEFHGSAEPLDINTMGDLLLMGL